jgi:hypothetical protein
MKFHPAVLMLMVWTGCIAAFYILPFQLEGRVMTLYGFMILMLFIATFCTGALVAARPQLQRPRPTDIAIDFRLTDRILMVAAIIAILGALLDVQGRNVLDLADAYQARSDRAGALLAGGESESTLWFQLAFLTYPAGYVYIVREVAFRARPVLWRIGVFGMAPVVLTSLAMGGPPRRARSSGPQAVPPVGPGQGGHRPAGRRLLRLLRSGLRRPRRCGRRHRGHVRRGQHPLGRQFRRPFLGPDLRRLRSGRRLYDLHLRLVPGAGAGDVERHLHQL